MSEQSMIVDGIDFTPINAANMPGRQVAVVADYTPVRHAESGISLIPNRPPAVKNPHTDIQGYSQALSAVADAMTKRDELQKLHDSQSAKAREFAAKRADLVRKVQLGETVPHGAAGKLDRERSDFESDAAITQEAMVAAEREITVTRNAMKILLRAECQKYYERLHADALEASGRFVKMRDEFNAKEGWALRMMNQVRDCRELEEFVALLGING